MADEEGISIFRSLHYFYSEKGISLLKFLIAIGDLERKNDRKKWSDVALGFLETA